MLRLATALLFLVGCGAQIPRPTDAQVTAEWARWPRASRATLERGRELYIYRCSGCHTLHSPSKFPAVRWPGLVHEMAPQAKLGTEETDLVVHYLMAVAGK